jgi:hypothetical protein
MTDNWSKFGVHWQVQTDGSVCLGVQNRATANVSDWRQRDYVASSAIGPDRLGKWVHLAVVYDGGGDRVVSHYLDGRSVARIPLRHVGKIQIGDAELGNWTLKEPHGDPDRGLTGRIDEFAMFGRALSGEEIQKMYQAGLPNPEPSP